ncbi:hypothetical protein BHE74_00005658, partial [Ensete ventricosum]
MAKLSNGLFVLSFLFVLLASVPVSLSSQKKASSAARREDIPYIKCQVCEKVAHQIYHQVMDKEAQVSPKKVGILNPRSVSEFQIIEIAENICNLKKEQADWMLQIDIVEKGDRLQVCKQLVDLIPLIYVLCSNLYLRSDWLTPDIVLTYSSLLNKGSKGCATRNVRPLNVLAKRSYFNIMFVKLSRLAKGEEEEDEADADALHLRRHRSVTASALTTMQGRATQLDIYVGANANVERRRPSHIVVGVNANAERRCSTSMSTPTQMHHPLPLPYLSLLLFLLIHNGYPRPLVMGYADTDVAEFVFKTRPSADSLVKFLCHDLSEACSSETPPVPKDRLPGDPFLAKPSKEAEMEKMLRSMEGIPGAPSMKMYSREDLMKNNFGDEQSDDDDDDDDDDDNFPAKLVTFTFL